MHYVIQVLDNNIPKYVFNKRMLLDDYALANRFPSLSLAKRFFRTTNFTGCQHCFLEIHEEAGYTGKAVIQHPA